MRYMLDFEIGKVVAGGQEITTMDLLKKALTILGDMVKDEFFLRILSID
jgi:hypothetical protein